MESLNIALTKTQQAIDETQKIGFHLWPPTLEDAHLGILPTISWFCREFQQAHPNICVDVKVDINEDEVNDSLKPAAYKLLRDALNNTKCCKASLVHVFFLRKGHKVVLTIQDDGQGFDMEKEGSTDSGFAWSFDIMKERAEITGGSFSIESAIGKETRIHVSWPT
jgi:signal transduction histidine kinase